MDAFVSMRAKLLDQIMKSPGTHHDQNVAAITGSTLPNPSIEERSTCQLLNCQDCTPFSSDVPMMGVVVLSSWGKQNEGKNQLAQKRQDTERARS